MTGFKAGDPVHIPAIDGTVVRVRENVTFPSQPDELMVQVDGHGTLLILASLAERAEPQGWPPQIGDIWKTESGEYIVRENQLCPDDSIITSINYSGGAYSSRSLDHFKELNPELVRRREVTGE